jgi:flagellar biosynthetic protein FliR
MPIDFPLSVSTILAFALVLTRISGAFVFMPLPGLQTAPNAARIVLSLSFTIALFPRWPSVPEQAPFSWLATAIAAEATFGVAIGLAVSCILEALVMGAQLLSLQAGYNYASTIDPNTQADSTALLVMGQMLAGLLFFAMGLDRLVLRAFSQSLSAHPPGALVFRPEMGMDLVRLSAGIFVTGFRLVLPLMALLLMLDISLGLLGRLNSHLQVISLAFPVKMLATMAMLAWAVLLFPRSLAPYVETAFSLVRKFSGP